MFSASKNIAIIKKGTMKNKILVIGQLPPPYHGSNVMAKVMVSALNAKGYKVNFIDKSFAKSIDTIGKPTLRKILRVPVLAIEILVACLFARPSLCIFFIAVGKSAFLIDACLIYLIRLCRLPYILRFGGKGYKALQNENLFWRYLVSSTFSSATGGIVLGENMKWDVNMFIPDDKLIYVPNGIENHPISLKRAKNGYVQILFLSNLHPQKGPLELLRAANIVVRQLSQVRFVLAGDISSQIFAQRLRSFIIDHGLEDYVSMPGKVYGGDKDRLFSESDIFVFPSYFRLEVFGTVNIEAMSWGLPVISSNEAAIPEVVLDGVNGFIIDPRSPEEIADRILTLINDLDLRVRMGRKFRELFESKYTLEAHSDNLSEAIRSFFEKIECKQVRNSKMIRLSKEIKLND